MVYKDYINDGATKQDGEWEEFDDAEETLSFSDLPLNNSFSIDEYSKEYQSSSFDQDNFFEFFSQDFTTYHPANHIIFCGKLIPTSDKPQKQELIKSISPRNSNKSRIFPWKPSSFRISKQEKCYKTCKSFPVSADRKYSNKDCSRKRVNSGKSRWYLFGRFPMEMELRDIKTRQSKRKPSTMFQYHSKTEMVKNHKTKRLKGLWGLLRDFVFS